MPSSRSYDNHNHHRNPNSNSYHRGGGGRNHLPFDSPPPPNYPTGPAFQPMGFRPTGAGFRPTPESGPFIGGGGYPMPHAGQKRGHPRGNSPDGADGGSFAKLFVGSVPKTATEEDVRPLFEEHGDVIEVALLKDKRTGQQQGCCFIKYATPEEADRAIGALHNKYTLPGGTGPIQVRFADGERERLVEHKLFVGSLNKQATEKEIEEVFSPYGRVEDVYIMRDEVKQSRGCGFVKYSHREMAAAAIAALNGVYVMRGCEQPLTVRFADPKRPRGGESRGAPASGGPGFSSRSQAFPGARPPPYLGEPMGGPAPPNAWHPMSPQSSGPSPQVNSHGSGSHLTDRGGVAPVPSIVGGPLGVHGGPMNGSHMGFSLPPPSFQQNSDPTLSQAPSVGQQVSPMQKPLQSPQRMLPPFQPHSQQMPLSYSQKETPPIPVQQAGQLQNPSSTSQSPLTPMSSQHLFGFSGQVPHSQSQVQHTPSSAGAQFVPPNYQRQGLSAPVSQQQLLQPLQQSPTQLAQVLSQQTQALQASFQSSQQAFSQLQQQLHLIQQSSQNPSQHQATQSQATKQSSPWPGAVPDTGASTPVAPAAVVTSASSAATGPVNMQMPAPQTCNWTEHTSPEGYKYYYNSVTAESRWEKPEEMIFFEQQQQQKPQLVQQQPQPPQQQLQQQSQPQPFQQQQQLLQQQQKPSVQLQPYSHPQMMSSQQVSQTQPAQLQTQIHNQQQFQLQRSLLPSSDLGYAQPQPAPNFGIDPAHYQQGPQSQAAQEWMWKNKPAGA